MEDKKINIFFLILAKVSVNWFNSPIITAGRYAVMITDVKENKESFIEFMNEEATKDNITFLDNTSFIKSVYYKGLAENNATPKALTLVKNVVVPQAWSDFFGSSNTKIKSIQEVGQVDINPFVSHLIRFFKSDIISSKTASKTLWKQYLCLGTITTEQFCLFRMTVISLKRLPLHVL